MTATANAIPRRINWFPKIRLTPSEQNVYRAICLHYNKTRGDSYPSYETIAEVAQVSRRWAIICVRQLIAKGLVLKVHRKETTKRGTVRQTSNLYRLSDMCFMGYEVHHSSEVSSPPPPPPQPAPDKEKTSAGSEVSSPEPNKSIFEPKFTNGASAEILVDSSAFRNGSGSGRSSRPARKRPPVADIPQERANKYADFFAAFPDTAPSNLDPNAYSDALKVDVVGAEPDKQAQDDAKDAAPRPITPSNVDRARELWSKCMNALIANPDVPKASFHTWFDSARAVSFVGGLLVVEAANRFAQDWIESRYSALITETFKRITHDVQAVRITLPLRS